MLYFDFLKEQDPEFVKRVFQHHEWDVLSLMTLYTHLLKKIIEVKQGASTKEETFEIARWYEAAIECARLYEYKKKDYEKALFFTKVALLEQDDITKRPSIEVKEIKRKAERLYLKLAKN